MTLDNRASSARKLFRDWPFPRAQLLDGGNAKQRLRALDSAGMCDVLGALGGLPAIVDSVSALSTLRMRVLYVAGVREFDAL
ncbi:hypothetical protein [Paraburkholderia tagetis]|uniref:Uncharacterized protein n=1 Tax=Paraburkholderia tagetis TaxID=2913261 RepID=A0A9X1ZYT3_9BURK|nr:hypothetical protein [Paraburkholderia tagetis]MCG5078498.1 hypothetical protein [Paraburkholderia tagetis]